MTFQSMFYSCQILEFNTLNPATLGGRPHADYTACKKNSEPLGAHSGIS